MQYTLMIQYTIICVLQIDTVIFANFKQTCAFKIIFYYIEST